MVTSGQRNEPSVSTTEDPVGLVQHLEADSRFHRDSLLGRILHPGTISFRERVREHSLHLLITGNQVSAHVDRYAPLTMTLASSRYSLWRATAHNLAHLGEDVVRLLTGRRGEHRCVLECRRVDLGAESVEGMLAASAATESAARAG